MDLRFALNHMVAPQLGIGDFFALAREVGVTDVEIRNDIAGVAIADGTPAATIRLLADEAGVNLLTINALQRFDDWDTARAGEALELISYAQQCGARALILVPTNDGTPVSAADRAARLRTALDGLVPLLGAHGITGLVEPLGFATSSLRSKREAAEAIEDVGGGDVLKLVHDTFHHHLAGEPQLFAALTGLVHISGVVDPGLAVAQLRDGHRVLVDRRDRIGNVEQVRALLAAGYAGPFSFEPFAAEPATLADPVRALRDSMDFIRAECAAEAA